MVASRLSHPASQLLLRQPVYRPVRRRCGRRLAPDHRNRAILGAVALAADPAGTGRCDSADGALCRRHGGGLGRSRAPAPGGGEIGAPPRSAAFALDQCLRHAHQGRSGNGPRRCCAERTSYWPTRPSDSRRWTCHFMQRRRGVSSVGCAEETKADRSSSKPTPGCAARRSSIRRGWLRAWRRASQVRRRQRHDAARSAVLHVLRVPRGQIYIVNLNPVQGREQAGRRPVLVLSIDSINAVDTPLSAGRAVGMVIAATDSAKNTESVRKGRYRQGVSLDVHL